VNFEEPIEATYYTCYDATTAQYPSCEEQRSAEGKISTGDGTTYIICFANPGTWTCSRPGDRRSFLLSSRLFPPVVDQSRSIGVKRAEARRAPASRGLVTWLEARASTNHRPPLARAILVEYFLGGQHGPQTPRTLPESHLLPPSKTDTSKTTN
jgi:hypothetical protein